MPTRIAFLLACAMVVLSSVLRVLNLILEEVHLDVIINYADMFVMVATAPYFLFFCR